MSMGSWRFLIPSSRSGRRVMAKPTSTPQKRGTPETLPCGRWPSPGNPPGHPQNAPRTMQALPEDAQVRLPSSFYPSSVPERGCFHEHKAVLTSLLHVSQYLVGLGKVRAHGIGAKQTKPGQQAFVDTWALHSIQISAPACALSHALQMISEFTNLH